MPDNPTSQAREALLDAEGLLHFIVTSKAANDANGQAIIEAIIDSAQKKIAEAMNKLPD